MYLDVEAPGSERQCGQTARDEAHGCGIGRSEESSRLMGVVCDEDEVSRCPCWCPRVSWSRVCSACSARAACEEAGLRRPGKSPWGRADDDGDEARINIIAAE